MTVEDKVVIEKYKLEPEEFNLATEEHKSLFFDIFAQNKTKFIPGGSALNSARAANFMLKCCGHDDKIVFCGSINNDGYGLNLEKELKDRKMQTLFYKDSGKETGTCVEIIYKKEKDKKERYLCANLGASVEYKKNHYDSIMHELKKAKIIYTTAFFIDNNSDVLRNIGKYAAENNIVFAFNLSDPVFIEFNT